MYFSMEYLYILCVYVCVRVCVCEGGWGDESSSTHADNWLILNCIFNVIRGIDRTVNFCKLHLKVKSQRDSFVINWS